MSAVITAGKNDFGQLGTGTLVEGYEPPKILKFFSEIVVIKVACGSEFSAALTNAGEIYTWGCNERGQLGLGDTLTRSRPTKVHSPLLINGVEKIACGDQHMLALNGVFELVSWGRNDEAQCGVGGVATLATPTRVPAVLPKGHRALQIACAAWHSAIVSDSGDVYILSTRVKHGMSPDGEALGVSYRVLGVPRVDKIWCGADFTIAASTARREAHSWGDNSHGQCGVGHTNPVPRPMRIPSLDGLNIRSLACGVAHVIAVVVGEGKDSKASVMAWGWDAHGQLGIGTGGVGRNVPTPVLALLDKNAFQVTAGGSVSMCLTEEGAVFHCGQHLSRSARHMVTPRCVPNLDHITRIETSGYHLIAQTKL